MENVYLMYEPFTKPLRDRIYHIFKYQELINIDELMILENECNNYGFTIEGYQKEMHNKNMRYKRMYKRIEFYFKKYKYLYFCTLTFDNEHIKKESYYFKQYKRIISKTNYQYIINKDIGEKERIHYHMILANNEPIKKTNLGWKYGFTDLKKIKNEDNGKITKYILKLNRHAFKDSAFKRIVYSRLYKKK